MQTDECLQCDRLREAYRRLTRNELDLEIQREAAELRRDLKRLRELSNLIAAANQERASACESILDHENTHVRRLSPPQENKLHVVRFG